MIRTTARLIAALLLAALCGSGCDALRSENPRDAIARTLNERDAALSSEDRERFLATVGSDFLVDPNHPMTESERLDQYFAKGTSFLAESWGRVISIDGDTAQARQRIRYESIDDRGNTLLDFVGIENLTLTRRNGGWVVNSARQDLDGIIALLEGRRVGMENADAALYLSTISPDYADGGFTYADVKAYVEKLFTGAVHVSYAVLARSIRVQDNSAEVIQEFTLTRAGADPDDESARGKERLLLGRDGRGRWGIVGGLTIRPADPGAESGAKDATGD